MGKMREGIRDKVAIVGAGCSKFGENWDKSPEDMIVEAAFEAYEDAGIESPQEPVHEWNRPRIQSSAAQIGARFRPRIV